MENTSPPELLKPAAAAQRLQVHTRTLLRWEALDLIHPRRLPSGHRRYDASEIDALIEAESA